MANKVKGRPAKGKAKSAGPAARPQRQEENALTLSEVAVRTGISMPTLQRYKKLYQSRIPSIGKGRTQRYPVASLAVFEALKMENIGRRGRPRKNASAPPAVVPARRGRTPGKQGRGPETAGGDGYLTLTAIAERTGISYPTLVRYSKVHTAELPFRGSGRARRYAPEAVEVFRRLRSESPRGRRPKSAPAPVSIPAMRSPLRLPRPELLVEPTRRSGSDAQVLARLQAIERAQATLDRQLRELVRLVSKPVRITIDRQ